MKNTSGIDAPKEKPRGIKYWVSLLIAVVGVSIATKSITNSMRLNKIPPQVLSELKADLQATEPPRKISNVIFGETMVIKEEHQVNSKPVHAIRVPPWVIHQPEVIPIGIHMYKLYVDFKPGTPSPVGVFLWETPNGWQYIESSQTE